MVSPKLYTSAGMTDESCQIVFCKAGGEINSAGQEHAEDIETLLYTRKEAYDLCMNPRGNKISAKAYPLILGFATGVCR